MVAHSKSRLNLQPVPLGSIRGCSRALGGPACHQRCDDAVRRCQRQLHRFHISKKSLGTMSERKAPSTWKPGYVAGTRISERIFPGRMGRSPDFAPIQPGTKSNEAIEKSINADIKARLIIVMSTRDIEHFELFLNGNYYQFFYCFYYLFLLSLSIFYFYCLFRNHT